MRIGRITMHHAVCFIMSKISLSKLYLKGLFLHRRLPGRHSSKVLSRQREDQPHSTQSHTNTNDYFGKSSVASSYVCPSFPGQRVTARPLPCWVYGRKPHRRRPSYPAGGAAPSAAVSVTTSSAPARITTRSATSFVPIGLVRPARPMERAVVTRGAAIFGRLRRVVNGRPRVQVQAKMPQYQTWEEFSRAAEKLYLADPMKVSRLRGPGRPRGLPGHSRRYRGRGPTRVPVRATVRAVVEAGARPAARLSGCPVPASKMSW